MSILCSMVGATFSVAAAAQILRAKKGITAVGNAQVDTAQYKFGYGSFLGDGNGDYLQLGTYSDLSLTGDFTIECWYRIPGTVPAILPFYNSDHLFYLTNDGGTAKYAVFQGGSNRLLTSGITVNANTWYHVAFVRSGTTITAYHNGTSVSSATWAGTISNTTPTIGSYSTYFLNGHIDEYRISNSARYTASFTPSTTPFVNDDNTLLLLHMEGTDGSTYFEDDNGVYTTSRTAKTLTAQGNAQIDTGQSKFGGSAAQFDGTGDYILSPANSDYNFGTSSFTIEFWIRFNVAPTLYVPMALRTSGSIQNGEWWCEITNAEKKMYWGFKNQAGTQYYVNLALAGTAFTTGQWYHIALVNNAGTAQMYVDGVATGTTTALSGSFGNSTTDLWVGAGAGSYSLNGWMDEIRISNTVRYYSNFTAPAAPFVNDANTLLLIHADGVDAATTFTDDNTVGRVLTQAAAAGNAQISTAQSKFGGSSALFDGTGDYLDIAPNPDFANLMMGNFTIEFWFRSPLTGIDATYNDNIMGIQGGGSGSNGWIIRLKSNATLEWVFDGQGGYAVSGFTASANTWHHIAFVRSGTTLKCYTDGTERTVTSYADRRSNSGAYFLRIGKIYAALNDDYNGYVDEVRISKTARYSTGFTPSTTPFVNDSDTVYLFHMDGTNASTVIRDDNGVIPSAVTGTAVTFDGTGDYYSATGITTSATDSNKVLIAGTIYWAGGNNLQHVVNVRLGTGASDYGFWIWINGGRMQAKMVTGTGSNPTSIYENSENSLTSGAWNQFVIYWDTSSYTTNTKIFVNGSSKAISNEGTTAVNWNWGNTATTVQIGQKNSSQTGDGSDFNGNIAQIYINNPSAFPGIDYFWDSSASKPKDLGGSGTGTGLAQPLIYHFGNNDTFRSNNGTGFASYTLTANGGAGSAASNLPSLIYGRTQKGVSAIGNAQIDTAQSKFGGSSALLDGTDYIKIVPAAASDLAIGPGDFTIECWVRFASLTSGMIIDSRGDPQNGNGWCLYVGGSSTLRWYWNFGDRITSSSLSTNTWYHVALVRSGNDHKLYIDGTQSGSTYTAANSYTIGTASYGVWIGDNQPFPNNGLNGHIDEFRISNTARYTANFTPSTTPFQNDSNTVLLIHADGTDGSTVFVDDNGQVPKTV